MFCRRKSYAERRRIVLKGAKGCVLELGDALAYQCAVRFASGRVLWVRRECLHVEPSSAALGAEVWLLARTLGTWPTEYPNRGTK